MLTWHKLAIGEGAGRAISRLFFKAVGLAAHLGPLPGALLTTIVVGSIQIIAGLAVARTKVWRITRRQLICSILFGLSTIMAFVFNVLTFSGGQADLGVTTFIVAIMATAPLGIFDHFFFHKPLNKRQWLGVAIFILAGYAVLGFPNLPELLRLEHWVVYSLFVGLFSIFNEVVVRWIKQMDGSSFSFWSGLTMVTSCALWLGITNSWGIAGQLPLAFWKGAGGVGLAIVTSVWLKRLAYNKLVTMALKNVLMVGTYLVISNIFGIVVYHEQATLGKGLGVILFLAAFITVDHDAWAAARRYWKK